jgi:carbon monoxide dehydrogenase subunit G
VRVRRSVQVAAGADVVRSTITAADVFARCLPGVTVESNDADGAAGRFRVRVDGHQITYRGTATRTDGKHVLWRAEAEEIRGAGAVRASLSFSAEPDPGGSTLSVDARFSGSGRIAEFDLQARRAAAERMLERLLQAIAQNVARAAESVPAKAPPEQPSREFADTTEVTEVAAQAVPAAVVPTQGVRGPVTAVAVAAGALALLVLWLVRRIRPRR